MKVKKSLIRNGKQSDNQHVKRALTSQHDISSIARSDVQQEVTRLLNDNALSVQDIILKYKEIYAHSIESVKASDVIKVLERLEKLHGLHDNRESEDTLTLTLHAKSSEELEDMLTSTLKSTQSVIACIQARRVNRTNSKL